MITFGDQNYPIFTPELAPYAKILEEQRKDDEKFAKEGGLIVIDEAPFKRLVISPIGQANRDYDDIRTFSDAAVRGLTRTLKSGARQPLLMLPSGENIPTQYRNYDLAILLESLHFLYRPLENRKSNNRSTTVRNDTHAQGKVEAIGFTGFASIKRADDIFHRAQAIECGRAVARDIGGSDPERMSAPMVADYVEELFKGSAIMIKVIRDVKVIEKEFPCLGNM